MAYRTGQWPEWDTAEPRVTHVPEADPFIRRAYRKGWKPAWIG